uniref:Uncharacterized protein n=1 Tax=Lepeophtheirus salmonis TaxID=72036 RepID=A0A0K2THL9_LEPSM
MTTLENKPYNPYIFRYINLAIGTVVYDDGLVIIDVDSCNMCLILKLKFIIINSYYNI